jgi:radical SAM protein with 4Fe4S-binding SPASM domain
MEAGLLERAHAMGFPVELLPGNKSFPCDTIRPQGFLFDPGGFCVPCDQLLGKRDEAIFDYGNLEEANPFQARIQRRWQEYDPFSLPECTSCPYLPRCEGHCPLTKIHPYAGSSGTSGQPRCPSWRYNLAARLEVFLKAQDGD